MGFALRFTLARNPKAAGTNSDPIVVVVFCNYYDVILITSNVLCSSVVYDRLSCGKELCLSCRLLYCSCPLYSPLCIVGTRMNERSFTHSLSIPQRTGGAATSLPVLPSTSPSFQSCCISLCEMVVSISASLGIIILPHTEGSESLGEFLG